MRPMPVAPPVTKQTFEATENNEMVSACIFNLLKLMGNIYFNNTFRRSNGLLAVADSAPETLQKDKQHGGRDWQYEMPKMQLKGTLDI